MSTLLRLFLLSNLAILFIFYPSQMNTFYPVMETFRNPFFIPPYTSSNHYPRWTPRNDIFNPPPFQSSYTPFNPPFHHRRRGSYYYNPHRIRHPNQRPHPQWRPYRHVRSEEPLRPEAVQPRPEQGFRWFQWRHLDSDGAFGMERGVESEPRPVSPLGQFGESEVENQDEVDYETGYAETILDGGDGLDDGGIHEEENLNARGQSEGMEDTIREMNEAQTAEAFQSSQSLFDARWQDLLSREACLAARESTFREEQQDLTNERAKFIRENESLDWKRQELEKRESQLWQLHLAIQARQQLLEDEPSCWKNRVQRGLYMSRLGRRTADMDANERVRFEEDLEAGLLDDEELDKCWEECGFLDFS